MRSGLAIVSHEHRNDDHLRLFVQAYIRERCIFKGMESTDTLAISSVADEAIFLFSNKRKLAFRCCAKVLEEINYHVSRYIQSCKSLTSKDLFFNQPDK